MNCSTPIPGFRSLARCLLALACAAAGGCHSSDEEKLSSYLEELEFEAPLESATCIPVGEFRVPLAIRLSDDPREPPTWMRISFLLFAEVNPKDRSAVEDALQRYNGPLRDAVLRVCRRTGPDELSDPRLSAMKARLADAAKPLLGEHRVRQFIIDKYVSESL
ncbi:MAG: hypothetical protein KDA44_07985 [Planctomycetales bacterium]|nr:hypothetical protein [Planctomycetales bacterium]